MKTTVELTANEVNAFFDFVITLVNDEVKKGIITADEGADIYDKILHRHSFDAPMSTGKLSVIMEADKTLIVMDTDEKVLVAYLSVMQDHAGDLNDIAQALGVVFRGFSNILKDLKKEVANIIHKNKNEEKTAA